MKKSMRMLILAVMTAILVVLLIVPVNLSSDIIFRMGNWIDINGLKTCNCIPSGGTQCGCLTNAPPQD